MERNAMTSPSQVVNNEDGSILLLALFMLFAVTILGFFSTNTSTIETHATANNAYYKKVFYAAEAGLEHGRITLENQLLAANPHVDHDNPPTWNFALTDLASPDSPLVPQNSAKWIDDQVLGDCRYSVFVYDDWESTEGTDQDATQDSNSKVYIRSVASGPRGAMAAIEMILEGDVREEQIMDYTAQSGAGAVKASKSDDKEAVSGFTTQASNVGT